MNESEACTIIKNSFLNQGEFLFKIPDPTGTFTQTIQRPFDLIGSLKTHAIAIEAKYMKGLQSFNLKKVEDHQVESLLHYKNSIQGAISLVMLVVYVGMADYRVYYFDIDTISRRRLEGKNYLKKELELLPYFIIKSVDGRKLIINDLSILNNIN